MKKLIFVFALIGILTVAATKVANACTNIVIQCPGGAQHTVCCDDLQDLFEWWDIKCGEEGLPSS